MCADIMNSYMQRVSVTSTLVNAVHKMARKKGKTLSNAKEFKEFLDQEAANEEDDAKTEKKGEKTK